mgnify:CR=1 FL=1
MPEENTTLAPLCPKAYACRETHAYCQPAFPLDGDKFYFVGQGEEECPYKEKYGTLHTCSCPVRQEIYRRYKI